jgi:hypothetical protein
LRVRKALRHPQLSLTIFHQETTPRVLINRHQTKHKVKLMIIHAVLLIEIKIGLHKKAVSLMNGNLASVDPI